MSLIDPENPSAGWEVEVWAVNQNTARSMCERIARRYPLTEVANVTQATKRPNPDGEYKFICWLNAEVPNNDNSDN